MAMSENMTAREEVGESARMSGRAVTRASEADRNRCPLFLLPVRANLLSGPDMEETFVASLMTIELLPGLHPG
jgi:hypothetical protein